ncbi:hypothetical protein FHS61_001373 [Altererythrobacter atlanticus]|nr:hypothetical protein [Croceibacterium atlanticum]
MTMHMGPCAFRTRLRGWHDLPELAHDPAENRHFSLRCGARIAAPRIASLSHGTYIGAVHARRTNAGRTRRRE